jgi:hypothetical protein
MPGWARGAAPSADWAWLAGDQQAAAATTAVNTSMRACARGLDAAFIVFVFICMTLCSVEPGIWTREEDDLQTQ